MTSPSTILERAGDIDEPGPERPVPRPQRGGKRRAGRADARRRVQERRTGAPRENRHGSANINLRDPVIYRILNASHLRTGAVRHIYPSYDFAHGQCDAIGAGGRKVGATIHWVSAVDAFTSATGRRDFCGQFPGRSAPMYNSMNELAVHRFSIGTDHRRRTQAQGAGRIDHRRPRRRCRCVLPGRAGAAGTPCTDRVRGFPIPAPSFPA
jgi:hypothetical protein